MKPINEDIHVVAGEYAKEGEYWLKQLSDEPGKTVIPFDRPHQPGIENERTLDFFTFQFSHDTYLKLMKLRNESDPRLFMVLTAGVVLLMNKYTGSRDIIVGAPIYRQEFEGDFINTVLPLRSRLEEHMTFKDLLLLVRKTTIDAEEHQNYPMETLLYKLGLTAVENDFPLFDIVVLLENVHEKKYILPTHPSLIFSFLRTEDAVSLELEYNSLLYRRSTIERMVNHAALLLSKALSDVNVTISRMEMVTAEEKQDLLFTFNDTRMEYPGDKTLHQLVEEQAASTPDQLALVGGEEEGWKGRSVESKKEMNLTYRELNERSNRLARVLREKGVTTSSIVGLMVGPGIEMVAAMLGILKAGGAYLPLDPKTPGDRVVFMLKDSRASFILTTNADTRGYAFTSLQELNNKGIKPHFTAPRKQISHLDGLPFPNRSLVDLEKYNRHIGQVMVKDIISLHTARGCPYHCAYCSEIWHKKHVYRSAENILEELQMYYDMGVRRFSIFDDIFNVNRKNSWKFFELIIKKGLEVQLFFPNGLRGDLLSKDYIDLMAEAGLVCTAMALETASPRLQKLIDKNLNLDKFRENAEYFCSKYPHVVLELFTIHGFPTETEEEGLMTLDFIKSLKWVHFPYVFILKIYPETGMADLAMRHGVTREQILKSEDLAFHELSPTSPFKKSFTTQYQSDFLNDYFLCKERLLHVLPYQVKVFTRDEMIQKYDSYLPAEIKDFDDLLKLADISAGELSTVDFLPDGHFQVPDLNVKLRERFPMRQPSKDALRVLFLDLSQHFSTGAGILYDVVEPPLGGMYVMTYLKQQLGDQVDVKVAKSRTDFDSYKELKQLMEEFKPQVIAVRSMTFYRDFFHQAIAMIRQWGIDVPIVAGGPYATRNAHSLLQDRYIDLLVTSEGETAFCEIVKKIRENAGELPDDNVLKGINGIAFVPRSNNGKGAFAREILLGDVLMSPDRLARQSPRNPEPVTQSTDLAYVIYTSGSTGTPKGVLTGHRNAVNVLNWFAHHYNLQNGTHVIQLTNYTFDPSVEQIFASLFRGAAVYIADRELIGHQEEFARFIEGHQINVINFVPGALKELLAQRERLDSLQAVISGGEKLEESTKNHLLEKGYPLYNQYGPTETTIDALATQCSEGAVTLGTPIANTFCYILDRDRNLVPIGVQGELYIAGAGVSRGYLNRPELTAERFIKVNKKFLEVQGPFFQEGSWSLKAYRTGDLARWLSGGNIEFLGRRDHQVKIRGFRLELGEIESCILAHEALKSAVVVDMVNKVGDRFLCAYYVKAAGSDDDGIGENELREFLGKRLPGYMIPAYFVHLEELPRTPNGKIHRKALSNPDNIGLTKSGTQFAVPQTVIEKKVVEIWEMVLGRKNIGMNDNFFMIGGDSIKAIQIVSQLIKEGYQVKMRDIFENPRIADFVPMVKRTGQAADQSAVIGPVPLTPGQVDFFKRENVDLHHFNQAVMLYSPRGFAEETTRTVFQKLQEHHDAVRMTYTREPGGAVIQTNHGPDYPFSLQVVDLRKISNNTALLEKKVNEIQAGIDLENGPLMKLGLFRLADGDRLLIVVHHLVMDGVSWRILFEDLETLFQQHQKGEPLVLAPKSISFQQWARQLAEYANTPAVLAEKSWWKEMEKSEPPYIPRDFDNDNNALKHAGAVSISLTEEETQLLLTDVHQAFGTEINDILLTALGLGIQSIYHYPQILIALEGHGREEIFPDADLSRTIGWFTTTFPVILNMAYKNDLARQIKEIKENLHQIPDKGIGYGILEHLTAVEHKYDLHFKLKPRISFNYLGQFDADFESRTFMIAREPVGQTISLNRQREYELDVTGIIAHQRLAISITYSKKQFKVETVETLIHRFKSELSRLISFCASRQEGQATPSDFTYRGLSIDEVESIAEQFTP